MEEKCFIKDREMRLLKVTRKDWNKIIFWMFLTQISGFDD